VAKKRELAGPGPVVRRPKPAVDRKFVTALARGIDVLRAFSPKHRLLGNQEIAARSGLPKSTVSRLTYTLTTLGYLDYSERLGKYQLAPGVLALGYAVLADTGIRQIARPFMQEMVEETGASVFLGSRHRLSIVYTEAARPSSALSVARDIGSWVPMAPTAIGRAVLAAMREDERGRVLAALEAESGARWPTLWAGIEQALADYRDRGFTLSVGDCQTALNAVGVPISMPDGLGAFAFNSGGPAFLFPQQRLIRELGPRLRHLVQQVEAGLLRL
jgi:DNA-binding IclR family transcriptional regulator